MSFRWERRGIAGWRLTYFYNNQFSLTKVCLPEVLVLWLSLTARMTVTNVFIYHFYIFLQRLLISRYLQLFQLIYHVSNRTAANLSYFGTFSNWILSRDQKSSEKYIVNRSCSITPFKHLMIEYETHDIFILKENTTHHTNPLAVALCYPNSGKYIAAECPNTN